MSTFVLIHGAWHGAWCWDKVAPLLQKAGHKVMAKDLPCHGNDKTPAAEATLTKYVDSVKNILNAQSEPVILVGHSMGGMVITQAAEYLPHKIKMLVYLCAYVPLNVSLTELAQSDQLSLLVPSTILSEDMSCAMIKKEALKELFYHDCCDDDTSRTISLLCPEPIAPTSVQLNTTEENYGSIPKTHIETLEDKAIPPSFQEQMYCSTPFQKIIRMRTSHSPFFSAPEELVTNLLSLAR